MTQCVFLLACVTTPQLALNQMNLRVSNFPGEYIFYWHSGVWCVHDIWTSIFGQVNSNFTHGIYFSVEEAQHAQYFVYPWNSRCGFCGIMVFVCSDIGGRSGNPTRFLSFRWMGIKLELPHLLKKHIYIYIRSRNITSTWFGIDCVILCSGVEMGGSWRVASCTESSVRGISSTGYITSG